MSVISSQDAALRYGSPDAVALAGNGGIVDILDPCHLMAGAEVQAGQGPSLVWIAHGAINLERRSQHGRWEPLLLRDGEFYLRSAQQLQLRRAHQCRSEFEGIHLHIGRHILNRCTNGRGNTALALQGLETTGSADRTLRALLELLVAPASQTTRLFAPFVDGVTQAVVAQLASNPASAPRAPACNQHGLAPYKFRLVCKAMQEGLAEPFNLEHLAGLAGLSTFHFSRAFKKASGASPSRYFQRLRIERAKRMLSNEKQSIIDIAMAVGFRSPSHFSQVFRDIAGFSPSEYRNRFAFMQHVST